jgi:enolase-phosphatase E1
LLLDIEGTTTPVDFVFKVLFPYARAHAREYLASRLESEELKAELAAFFRENSEDVLGGLDPPSLADPPEPDSLVTYVHWLMDRDRKSTPLKSLQGKIWEEGYRRGELRGLVFEDVPRALERWRAEGKQICIFSSGSVLAQKLLFSHTEAGDLTDHIDGYFDTNMGAKVEPASYTRIAAALARDPGEILFVSDVAPELDAARSGGLQTRLCVRPGNAPQREGSHGAIVSFDRI